MSTGTVPRAGSTGTGEGTVVPGRRGRAAVWAGIAVVGLVLAVLTVAVRGTPGPSEHELDPASTTASGSRALVRVLEQRGTAVDVVRDADRTGTGTVFVDDGDGVLSAAVAGRLVRTARHVVLVTTQPAVLQAVGLDVRDTRAVDDAVSSTGSCPIPAVRAAGSVTATGTGYRVGADGASGARVERCTPSGEGADRVWGIVRTTTAAGDVTVLGTTAALRNDTITTAGNAGLALGLLGGGDRLVWYVPTPGSADAATTLGELAPPWVPSVLLLLALVAVAAAIWRGRRLGPLVVEPLPVVVRAAETTEGRARLYARTRDRTHALDTLRTAALFRIGRRLGLPRSAHVDDVVRAAARATGRPDHEVGAVLVGGPTGTDAALLDGAHALDDLERAVTAATTGTDHHDRPGARP